MQDGTVFSAQTETVDKESQSNVMVNEQLTASSNEELNATSIPVAKPQKLKRNSTENQCDIIILKTGREILAKVLEIGNAEVKYKMCDNLDGPTFTMVKAEIFMIKYPNGTSTVINEGTPSEVKKAADSTGISYSGERHIPGIIIWGFVFSVLGWFVPYVGSIVMLIGMLFCSAGLKKIKNNPEKYKGKGLAITGYVIGFVGIIVNFLLTLYLIGII
jgi:hypothetical protein